MTVAVEPLLDVDGLAAIEAEWEALDRELEPRTPFTSPLWLRLWWKHFHREGWLRKDKWFVHIVRDEGGKLLAVAPLIRVDQPAHGPVGLRRLRFFGADTSLTEVRGVICRRSDENIVFKALCDYLLVNRSEWDVIEWSGIRSGGGARAVLDKAGALISLTSTPMYLLQLSNWNDLVASVSANMRKNLRKAYERLRAGGHNFEFRVVEQADDRALNRFFRLHSRRAQASNMLVIHPDKFRTSRNRAFITEYITEVAKRNGLRIFELRIEGEAVASRLAFHLDDTLYFYYAGYDPLWRRSSVGTVLMAEALKWAIGSGLKTANLSAGKDLSKLRWKPSEIVFDSYTQISPCLRGMVVGQTYATIDSSLRKFSSPRKQQSSLGLTTPSAEGLTSGFGFRRGRNLSARATSSDEG